MISITVLTQVSLSKWTYLIFLCFFSKQMLKKKSQLKKPREEKNKVYFLQFGDTTCNSHFCLNYSAEFLIGLRLFGAVQHTALMMLQPF